MFWGTGFYSPCGSVGTKAHGASSFAFGARRIIQLLHQTLRADHFWHAKTAIKNGDAEIPDMLFEYGARVGMFAYSEEPLLCDLLHNPSKSRETKLRICRILVEHAETHEATEEYIQFSIDRLATRRRLRGSERVPESCGILFQAGVTPGREVLCDAIRYGDVTTWQLYDPFDRYEEEESERG
jgi:hypothetical protein